MLKQRVLTALVLLALLVPALWAESRWPFLVMIFLLLSAAAWEWARLCGGKGRAAVAYAAGVALLCGVAIPLSHRLAELATALWLLVGCAWVAGGAWALHRGIEGWRATPRVARWAMGVPILLAVWMAIVAAREQGVVFLLSCLVLVWVADIAAYFGGRLFGGIKLAPRISPGKTWSGAITGVVAVLAVSAVWWSWGPDEAVSSSLVSRLMDRWGVLASMVALVGLTAMSVVGDLFESLVKREAGVKDSSGLLPGHGGVLDRVDALLPVLPLCIMLTR
jgi:phosphatidate cytidylyltransferase